MSISHPPPPSLCTLSKDPPSPCTLSEDPFCLRIPPVHAPCLRIPPSEDPSWQLLGGFGLFSERLGSSEWQPSLERFGTEASKPQRMELRCGLQSCGKWTTQALGILWLFSLHDLVFPQTSAFLRFRLASRTRTPGHQLRTKLQCFMHLDRQWCLPTHPQCTHPRGSSRPGTPSLSARYSPLSKDGSENHIWRAGDCALVGKGGGVPSSMPGVVSQGRHPAGIPTWAPEAQGARL